MAVRDFRQCDRLVAGCDSNITASNSPLQTCPWHSVNQPEVLLVLLVLTHQAPQTALHLENGLLAERLSPVHSRPMTLTEHLTSSRLSVDGGVTYYVDDGSEDIGGVMYLANVTRKQVTFEST